MGEMLIRISDEAMIERLATVWFKRTVSNFFVRIAVVEVPDRGIVGSGMVLESDGSGI